MWHFLFDASSVAGSQWLCARFDKLQNHIIKSFEFVNFPCCVLIWAQKQIFLYTWSLSMLIFIKDYQSTQITQ